MVTLNKRQRLLSRLALYGALIAILWLMEKASEASRDTFFASPTGSELLVPGDH